MAQKEVKRISVRFYYANNADLVERAINTSGVSQTEWCRRALVEVAEFQIHGGGVYEVLLRNLLLIRRLIMRVAKTDPKTLANDKAWARTETEKIIASLKIGGEDNDR